MAWWGVSVFGILRLVGEIKLFDDSFLFLEGVVRSAVWTLEMTVVCCGIGSC